MATNINRQETLENLDLSNVCRVCLSSENCAFLIPLFAEFKEILSSLFKLEITHGEIISATRRICTFCLNTINKTIIFKNKVEQTNQRLKTLCARAETSYGSQGTNIKNINSTNLEDNKHEININDVIPHNSSYEVINPYATNQINSNADPNNSYTATNSSNQNLNNDDNFVYYSTTIDLSEEQPSFGPETEYSQGVLEPAGYISSTVSFSTRCGSCLSKTFKNTDDIIRHMTSKHKKCKLNALSHVCKICDIVFIRKIDLQGHEFKYHSKFTDTKKPNVYSKISSTSTPKSNSHNHHINGPSSITNSHHKTNIINPKLDSQLKVNGHSAKCHKVKNGRYSCKYCGKIFTSDRRRNEHHEVVHSDSEAHKFLYFKCGHCDYRNRKRDNCQRHHSNSHRDLQNLISMHFECDICSSGWSNFKQFQLHQQQCSSKAEAVRKAEILKKTRNERANNREKLRSSSATIDWDKLPLKQESTTVDWDKCYEKQECHTNYFNQ